jgi:hypothetical protein
MKIGELLAENVQTAADIRDEMLRQARSSFGHIQRTDEEYLGLLASCFKRQRDEARAELERLRA